MSEDEVSSPQSLALGNIEQVRIISAIGSTLRESCQNALIMLHIFRNTLSNVIRNISFLNRFYAMEMFFLVKFEKRKSYLDKYLEDLGSLIFFLTFNPSNYMDFDGFMRFCAYDLGWSWSGKAGQIKSKKNKGACDEKERRSGWNLQARPHGSWSKHESGKFDGYHWFW